MGSVPWNPCEKVLTFGDYTANFLECFTCVTDKDFTGKCSSYSDQKCRCYLQRRMFNISIQMRGLQGTTGCSALVPGDKSSRTLADWYFMCGHRAYTDPTRNWGVLCTLVPLSNAVVLLRKGTRPASRKKCSPMPEVRRWEGLTTSTDVPWNTGSGEEEKSYSKACSQGWESVRFESTSRSTGMPSSTLSTTTTDWGMAKPKN